MVDPFDLLDWLVGFWRYLLSPGFRRRKQREWREEAKSRWGRVSMGIDIGLATVIGLGVPALVLWWILA